MPYKSEAKRRAYHRKRHRRKYKQFDWRRKKLVGQADLNLRYRYGFGLKEKQVMVEAQNGVCANSACSAPFASLSKAHVDHHHASGRIRGLLCVRCNMALGYLRDDPAIIRSLALYAETH